MKKILIIGSLASLLVACNEQTEHGDAYGNFEVDHVMVAAEVSGKILKLELEEGQSLEEGEVVGALDTTQLCLKKKQLLAGMTTLNTKAKTVDAQLEVQAVQVENLERDLRRLENLVQDGAATTKMLEDVQGNVKLMKVQMQASATQKATLRAESNALMVQVEQVEDQIRRAYIRNPINGTVLQRYKEQGEVVAQGMTMYKIASLDPLYLRAYVSGKQLSEVKIGEEVKVLIDAPEGIRELSGRVSWVASEAEFTPKIIQTREERVNLVYAVRVEVQNDGSLKVGMPGELVY